MSCIFLKNGFIVNEGKILKQNLLIRHEKIEKIFKEDVYPGENCKIFDLKGKFVFPGVIDTHVHFREPGLTHKGDIESESKAALWGGVTSFVDMPNTIPPTVNFELWAEKNRIASQKAFVNYAFFLGATKDNIEQLINLTPGSVPGIKIFYGSSTGNLLLNDKEKLRKLFENQRVPYVVHSEDDAIINRNAAFYKAQKILPYDVHYRIRSEEACYKATSDLMSLAAKTNAKLHFLHISTAGELSLFEDKDLKHKQFTAETTVNYLWFDKEDFKKYGNLIKCNPSIKTRKDKQQLLNALNTNKIDVISTDHAPHLFEEKQREYFSAPSGIPSVQFSLLIMLELHKRGFIKLEKIAEKMAHNPARLFGIEKRGFIREGYYADLLVVDLNGYTEISKDLILSRCGWSPFEGEVLGAKIDMVFINGNLAVENGKIKKQKVYPLRFSKTQL